jgi:hypothetical protein
LALLESSLSPFGQGLGMIVGDDQVSAGLYYTVPFGKCFDIFDVGYLVNQEIDGRRIDIRKILLPMCFLFQEICFSFSSTRNIIAND